MTWVKKATRAGEVGRNTVGCVAKASATHLLDYAAEKLCFNKSFMEHLERNWSLQ